MMALRRRHRQVAERKENNSPLLEEGQEEDGDKITWIESTFRKRECVTFIPLITHDGLQRCGCGRTYSSHLFLDSYEKPKNISPKKNSPSHFEFYDETLQRCETNLSQSKPANENLPLQSPEGFLEIKNAPKMQKRKKSSSRLQNNAKWNVVHHTTSLPTDAYGTLEYQGTGEGDKSQYIRLAHDTHPEYTMRLLTEEWGMQRPKMVITVHGGVHNFQLQPKLRRVFCDGLIKAAKTTGAWIMLSGLNTGVGSIVGNALKEHKARSRGRIYSIGVAPWGVVDNREDLITSQAISSYQTMANPLSKGAVLNAAHTHFLLVDNGTEGKYGSELKFRRRLERKLSLQQINQKHGRKIPVVCLVLEGGKNTINVVLESVRQSPPIPVIVVDGSGRAADLLAFAHQYAEDDGTLMEDLRLQLLITIQNTFACGRDQAQFIFLSIMECVRRKDLITVFRLGQGQNKQDDIDNAILTASLRARRTSAPDMLSLALTWNRIDIATSQIFVYGQHWPVLSLEHAMMDALIQDRMDFVKLLMENGVSMHKFLTIPRLEELYNIKQIPVHLLYLLQDVKKSITLGCRFNLIEIGQVIEGLMGGAYRCNYTKKRFRLYYATHGKFNIKKQPSFTKKNILPTNLSKLDVTSSFRDFASIATNSIKHEQDNNKNNGGPAAQICSNFQYPFHDLMVWAVLMKRQKMAIFMWQHGEEAIAKALVAAKLYKAMAREAADDELDLEEMEELRRYSGEFSDLATQLLEICYRADTDATQHLLTYELKQWSKHTCLSLAIAAQHREFIAHPCVQLLLNDLWMGGLNVRKNSSLRVILGILFPPSLYMLQFKSPEELQLMPQTAEEHMDERNDSSSISSSSSSSLSSSTSSSSSSSSSSSGSITSGFQHKPEVVVRGVTGLDQSNRPPDPYDVFMSQQRQLPVSKKLYEFYNAPITKFWLYTISYNAFLLMFTYVVLVSMGSLPSVMEWIVISYIFTLSLEKMREIIASEPSGGINKLKLWLGHFWHRVDIVLLLTFFSGFVLRMMQDEYLLKIGRALYCVNIALWYIRLLNIFSVSKYLGPYVMMMGKMMVDLGTFIILLAVVLISFGVTRQAILYPDESPKWSLIRDVVFEPYFMLYGEVYAGKIDPCSKDNATTLCVVGSWIVPTAMTLYLLVANILLLNMLIAVFNNTFTKVKNISDKIWKFHRYGMIVEYEFRPTLPPPFIVISYIFMLVRLCLKKRKKSIFNSDRGLKLFLDDEDVEKLHDFEEDCLDDFFRQKDFKKDTSKDLEMAKVPFDRMERILDFIDESEEHDRLITSQLRILEERLTQLEEMNMKILRTLPQLVDGPYESSEDSQHEYDTEDNFATMRERMRFHIHRLRQDSEMSTLSDWNPSNILMQRFKSHNTKNRERHASERLSQAALIEHKLRKTNSTGNMEILKRNSMDNAHGPTMLETPSGLQSSSYHALMTRPFVDSEQKSVSCQDFLMLKDDHEGVGIEYQDPIKTTDDIVSGSEFLPSDYVDENTPVEIRKPSFGTSQKPKIRFSDNIPIVDAHPSEYPQSSNTQREALSGNERSCSSISESDDQEYGMPFVQRRKRIKGSGRFVKKKFNTGTKLPMLVINSPERLESTLGLTPVEDNKNERLNSEKQVKLKRGPNSYPLLNLMQERNDSTKSRRMTHSPGLGFQNNDPNYQSTSFNHNLNSPGIRRTILSSATPNQSFYKSITDCIDTSRWHDANSTAVPQTPFEMWLNKPEFSHQSRSPIFQSDRISLDEWEDEPPSLHPRRSSRRGKRHHRTRSRLYSNNSSSSIKSASSKHRRGSVRKRRHKRKKKLQKALKENLEEENTALTSLKVSECQKQLSTVKENSALSSSQILDHDNTVFIKTPTPIFNINNCNLKQISASKNEDGSNSDSFMSRYACINHDNSATVSTNNQDANEYDEKTNLLSRSGTGTTTYDKPLLC
ncbi:transient receptor potential cation channel subfamily M member 1-like isoform X2 [Styela clava]